MAFITLRLVAPEATIRGPVVGDNVSAQDIPGPSFITGIFGAALGIRRYEGERLNRIQDSIEIGYILHREPHVRTDFQTADLSKRHMVGPVFVNDGKQVYTTKRAGGDAERTLISLRDITSDVDMTAVVEWTLDDPSPEDILRALQRPYWTLTIGARWCTPSEPIAGRILTSTTMEDALREAAEIPDTDERLPVVRTYTPVGLSVKPMRDPVISVSARDFVTRKHGGSYFYAIRSA